jgi:hypothetical protein
MPTPNITMPSWSAGSGPAILAAVVNGVVVLFLPLMAIEFAGGNDYSATVHPPGGPHCWR